MTMSKKARIAGMLLVLAVGAGGGWFYWFHLSAATDPEPRRRPPQRAVAVEVAPVQRTTLRDLRTFSGTLQARSQFVVAPKIAGRLERLAVDIGDRVKQGQVVARLDDDEVVQQVSQAKAELGVARAGLAEAQSLLVVKRREYERNRLLHQQRIASTAELEVAQAEAAAQEARVAVARAQVTQREAAVRAAEVRLQYTVIRATWHDGPGTYQVGERFVNQGDMLSANEPILSLVDAAALVGVVFAAETDYPHLRVGLPANVSVEAYPERTFRGRLARLAPVFRETSRQARVEVAVDNAEGLLNPGSFVLISVEVGRAVDAQAVPLEAVVSRGGQAGVFTAHLEEKRVAFVPVTTGITEKGLTQIVTPELTGPVVTLGNHLLSDGVAIIPSEPEATPVHRAGPDGAVGSEQGNQGRLGDRKGKRGSGQGTGPGAGSAEGQRSGGKAAQ